MYSNELKAQLAPIKRLTISASLPLAYRALYLSRNSIKGCFSSGILELKIDHGLTEPVYVLGANFLAIIDSLPDKQTVDLRIVDNALAWTCGNAKGRIATLSHVDMPSVDEISGTSCTPSEEFCKALALGGVSCGSVAAIATGSYGVALDNSGDFCIYSTDDVTISICFCDIEKDVFPKLVTLAPEAADLLSSLIDTKNGSLVATEEDVFYNDPHCKLLIKQMPAMSKDVPSVIAAYLGGSTKVEIDPDRVGAFIKRVTRIAEQNTQVYVALGIKDEKLIFSFDDGISSSEEYYLCDELKGVPDTALVRIDAVRAARALKHSSRIVLDHIDRGPIVFEGSKPDFHYIIAGRHAA